jgi:hypothetical protein
MRLRRALFLVLFSAASAAGCASAASQGTSEPSSVNRLTRSQLASANSADNVYDAIAKLRPEWLSSRGPTSVTDATPTSVSVYMNGSMLGKADYLKQVAILDVSEVRYWNSAQASARFGMGHPRGVVEIIR